MTTPWRCAVCETVNSGGTTCAACGAVMTRASSVVTRIRGTVAPVPAPADPRDELPEPVRRAIAREPIDENEWPFREGPAGTADARRLPRHRRPTFRPPVSAVARRRVD
jgi:hypothetical protein